MFMVHCPAHGGGLGARVLIWPSGVDAVRNTARGIEVDYHCTCGHRGTWLTGRDADATGADATGADATGADATDADATPSRAGMGARSGGRGYPYARPG